MGSKWGSGLQSLNGTLLETWQKISSVKDSFTFSSTVPLYFFHKGRGSWMWFLLKLFWLQSFLSVSVCSSSMTLLKLFRSEVPAHLTISLDWISGDEPCNLKGVIMYNCSINELVRCWMVKSQKSPLLVSNSSSSICLESLLCFWRTFHNNATFIRQDYLSFKSSQTMSCASCGQKPNI